MKTYLINTELANQYGIDTTYCWHDSENSVVQKKAITSNFNLEGDIEDRLIALQGREMTDEEIKHLNEHYTI